MMFPGPPRSAAARYIPREARVPHLAVPWRSGQGRGGGQRLWEGQNGALPASRPRVPALALPGV